MRNKLVFFTEARFFCDDEGVLYFEKAFDIKLWDRYLENFDELVIFARIEKINDSITENFVKNTDSRIKFVKLPYFIGLKALLKNITLTKRIIAENILNYKNYSFILRVPGVIGFNAAKLLNKYDIKYSVEVVGDPSEVFSKNNFDHPLRPFLKFIAISNLKYVVKNANNILYVTQSTLQEKYPSLNSRKFGISDVRIEDNLINKLPKKYDFKSPFVIISIGSLEQMYKSPDIVLKSIYNINNNKQVKVRLVWLGEGRYKKEMIKLANQLNISEYVEFKGNISREDVMCCLDNADLFVLASKTEGLPRVIVEAMAKGLPIVATNVGGIPELLSDDVLVSPNSVDKLSSMISEILTNQELYNFQAVRNLNESQKFKKSILDKKRMSFFSAVKDI